MTWSHAFGIAFTHELIFAAADDWYIHVVGRWAELFKLLPSEDIDSDQVNLSVTVLARLGGGHFDDLAWAVLDHDETVLAKCRALHGKSRRCAGILLSS